MFQNLNAMIIPMMIIMMPKILCIHLPAYTYLFPSLPQILLVTAQSGIMGMPCALFAHPKEVDELVQSVGAYKTDMNLK